jgi:hypothetical protein
MVGDIQVVAKINEDRQAAHTGQVEIEFDGRITAGELS